MKSFAYVVPRTVAQAIAACGQRDTVLKGGGTDLLDLMKGYVVTPERVVHLMQIPELRGITERDGALHVGATTTLAELAADPRVPAALREAAAETATPQIRTTGTVGGNLCQRPRCWYFRDQDYPCLKKGGATCFSQEGDNRYHAIFDNKPCAIVHPSNLGTALVTLDADVVTDRRIIPAGEFFVLPSERLYQENVLKKDELVTHLVIRPGHGASVYREAREKQSFDWATFAVAVYLELARDGAGPGKVVAARIGLGAVSPAPRRAEQAERLLVGQRLDARLAARAAEAALAGATPMTHNAYKVPLGKALVRRAVLAAAGLPEDAPAGQKAESRAETKEKLR